MQVGVEVYMLHVYRINHDRQLCNSYVVLLEEQLETLDKDSITGCTLFCFNSTKHCRNTSKLNWTKCTIILRAYIVQDDVV